MFARINPAIAQWKSDDLLAALEAAKLPCGKINTIPEALVQPQTVARELVQEIARDDGTPVRFVGFPAKLSASPATYRLAPPRSGQNTRAVLGEVLGLSDEQIDALAEAGVLAEKL